MSSLTLLTGVVYDAARLLRSHYKKASMLLAATFCLGHATAAWAAYSAWLRQPSLTRFVAPEIAVEEEPADAADVPAPNVATTPPAEPSPVLPPPTDTPAEPVAAAATAAKEVTAPITDPSAETVESRPRSLEQVVAAYRWPDEAPVLVGWETPGWRPLRYVQSATRPGWEVVKETVNPAEDLGVPPAFVRRPPPWVNRSVPLGPAPMPPPSLKTWERLPYASPVVFASYDEEYVRWIKNYLLFPGSDHLWGYRDSNTGIVRVLNKDAELVELNHAILPAALLPADIPPAPRPDIPLFAGSPTAVPTDAYPFVKFFQANHRKVHGYRSDRVLKPWRPNYIRWYRPLRGGRWEYFDVEDDVWRQFDEPPVDLVADLDLYIDSGASQAVVAAPNEAAPDRSVTDGRLAATATPPGRETARTTGSYVAGPSLPGRPSAGATTRSDFPWIEFVDRPAPPAGRAAISPPRKDKA